MIKNGRNPCLATAYGITIASKDIVEEYEEILARLQMSSQISMRAENQDDDKFIFCAVDVNPTNNGCICPVACFDCPVKCRQKINTG